MDKRFVQAALDGVRDISPLFEKIFGTEAHIYTGGWRDVVVEWLPKGTVFTVEEYDGSESLRTYDDLKHVA